MTREPIYAALFGRVSSVSGFVTMSRRLLHFSEVDPAAQPALFQAQVSEKQETRKGLPAKVTLYCKLWLYANTGNDMSVTPATTINPLVDAVEAALAPDANGFQTLGNTVSHCRIEGEMITDEGLLGPQAIVVIPVSILVNN